MGDYVIVLQAHFDPPYIYNIQDHREDDILEAVQEIMKHPLKEAFIPDDMKKEVYLSRYVERVFFPPFL